MGTAHFYGHFTFCTSERERGNRRTLRFCAYATLVHEAPGVSESTMQSLVGSMEEFVNDVHVQAQDTVLKCLSSEVTEQTLNKVKDCFEQLDNPFSSLNTETKRQKKLFMCLFWELLSRCLLIGNSATVSSK